MTHVVAQRINPELPVDLCVKVGSIIEREYRELFQNASERDRQQDVCAMMRDMDVDTAVSILWAEGWPLAC